MGQLAGRALLRRALRMVRGGLDEETGTSTVSKQEAGVIQVRVVGCTLQYQRVVRGYKGQCGSMVTDDGDGLRWSDWLGKATNGWF